MSKLPELTICSVYHKKETSDLLSLNRRLTSALNKDTAIRWIAADNSPRDMQVSHPEGGIEVFPGFEISDFEKIYAKPIVYPFHASSAMNSLLAHCRTRFVLFLDADFFIVRPNWIEEIILHMNTHSLGAFGAPWYPQYAGKLRYYPAHNCLFVDTSRIPAMELNFHPDYPFEKTHLATNPIGKFPVRKSRSGSFFDRYWASIEERFLIGTSRDVSYRIAQLLMDSKTPLELVQPVWKPEDHGRYINRLLNTYLPERYSLMPKRSGYFSTTGFGEKGHHNFYADKMEEYMWQSEPFAVHMRNTSKRENIADTLPEFEKHVFSVSNMKVD